MRSILWWIGWRPKVALIIGALMGVLTVVNAGSPWGLLVVVPLVVLWLAGASHTNAMWRDELDRGVDAVAQAGLTKLDVRHDEAALHILRYGTGKATLIVPARSYQVTPLYVGVSFLGILEGSRSDMVRRRSEVGSGTKELY